MKEQNKRYITYGICTAVILVSLKVLVTGEVGATTGSGVFKFHGWGRLYAFYPIGIAGLIIWGIKGDKEAKRGLEGEAPWTPSRKRPKDDC